MSDVDLFSEPPNGRGRPGRGQSGRGRSGGGGQSGRGRRGRGRPAQDQRYEQEQYDQRHGQQQQYEQQGYDQQQYRQDQYDQHQQYGQAGQQRDQYGRQQQHGQQHPGQQQGYEQQQYDQYGQQHPGQQQYEQPHGQYDQQQGQYQQQHGQYEQYEQDEYYDDEYYDDEEQAQGQGGGHLLDDQLNRGDRLTREDQRRARSKQRRRKGKGRAAVLFAMAFLVAIVGTGGVLGYAWLDNRMHPPDYPGQGSGNVIVQVKDGDSGSVIASTLQKHDVVKSVRAFLKVYSHEPKASSLQPGYYQMRLRMSSKAAMALLLDPKARAGNMITLPEGLRANEVFEKLSKKTGISVKSFQNAAKDGKGLGLPSYAKGKVEGYLYPGQYNLNPSAPAKDILKQMVDRFNQEARDLDLVNKSKGVGLDPGQVVTLASLLQAEGGTKADYPKIARVLYNRIRAGRPLQLDTTVLYALNKRTLHVTYKDTQVKSPYNSYLVKPLPVGAIDSPGADALKAALDPAKGPWLFFVTTDPSNGYTEYGTTEAEFTRMKAKLDKWLAAHPEGK
ncbi:endolytic transglycosylase MltG [Actinomadura rupiterrae]|uniref:endolytic transglycosylase MltG n=1 Tax=Actinomadura rupiterrae TaxID=559627 RepID=UPI0020A4A78D|nr:endolytic transglycosylase MltG [Actinomadura rupiterrae]MCP2340842.1 UPF0755 protein [Actinomadura rupiterrae]